MVVDSRVLCEKLIIIFIIHMEALIEHEKGAVDRHFPGGQN